MIKMHFGSPHEQSEDVLAIKIAFAPTTITKSIKSYHIRWWDGAMLNVKIESCYF